MLIVHRLARVLFQMQSLYPDLDRFIAFKKNDFIGRDAALAERETPPPRRLCTFVVEAEDADVWADEPIWKDGKVVGFVTSGGYAHHVGASIALGWSWMPKRRSTWKKMIQRKMKMISESGLRKMSAMSSRVSSVAQPI